MAKQIFGIVVLLCALHHSLLTVSECDVGEYLSESSGRCEMCPLGHYKSNPGNEACSACADDDPSLTTTAEGAANQSQCIHVTLITGLEPGYGPMAGGTHVTITLTTSSQLIPSVSIASIACPIQSVNEMKLTCVTGPSHLQRSAQVKVTYSDGAEVLSPSNFTYMPNPVVSAVHRNKTIISGGLLMNIYGYYLTSVASPILRITRIYKEDISVIEVPCKVFSSAVIPCVLPPLYDGFYHPRLLPSNSRRKRDIGEVIFNDKDTHFYAGIIFDGERSYTNFSSIIPEFRELEVHGDPVIDKFEGNVLTYDPSGSNRDIYIWGNYLNSVLMPSDIVVTVGKGFCTLTSNLTTNNFMCQPPPTKPEFEEEDYGAGESPRVRVHIGLRLKHVVGYLDYTSGGSGMLGEALGAVFGLVGAGIVLVCLITCWVRRCRMANKDKHAGLESRADGPPNLYTRGAGGETDGGYLAPTPSPGQTPAATISTMSSLPSHPSTMSSRSHHSGSSVSQPIFGHVSGRPSIITLGQGRPSVITLNSQGRPSISATSQGRPSISATSQGRPSISALSQGRPSVTTLASLPRSVSQSTTPPSSPGVTPSTPATEPNTPNMLNNVAYQVLPRFGFTVLEVLDTVGEDLKMTVEECLIEGSRLEIGATLGKGFFGKVYKGMLKDENGNNGKTVAVKTAQGKQGTMHDVTSFLEEAVMMKDFDHENVLSLLGVVLDDSKPYVILPYMENGDLKTYISHPSRRITVRELIGFGLQVSKGMSYLASQKFVHRDLATRNCMVDKSTLVKIADFGLSRDIYKSDYYRVETKHRPLPVKWMAIESLTEGVFSTKTDVWSFGVLLWELMTRGCSPYADIDSFKIKAYLSSGRRLSQPEHAPDEIYTVMKSCWLETAEERPSFQILYEKLQDTLDERSSVPEYLQIIDT